MSSPPPPPSASPLASILSALYSSFLDRPTVMIGSLFPILFLFFDSTFFFIVSILIAFIPLILIILYYYYKAPSPVNPSHLKGKLIAHRGGKRVEPEKSTLGDFPENSMAAFRFASTTSAHGIEIDIWLSSDGVAVVSHDYHVEGHFRGGRGRVNHHSLDELKKMQYKKTKGKKGEDNNNNNNNNNNEGEEEKNANDSFEVERIPTLKEVVEFIADKNLFLMIEIKEKNNRSLMTERILEIYSQYPFLYDRSWVASFDPIILYMIRIRNPRILSGFLYTDHLTYHVIKNLKADGEIVPLWIEWSISRFLIDQLLLIASLPVVLKFIGCSLALMEESLASRHTMKMLNEEGLVGGCWVVNDTTMKQWLLEQNSIVITDILLEKKEKQIE